MRWVEPWYAAYAIVGMLILGVAPILLPVTVEDGGRNGATVVGLVVAAFYAGGLLAPVLGSLADRTGHQRAVFLWCFPVMAVAVAGSAFADELWLWVLLALVFGGAGALAGTVAGLFVVEAHPRAEWNDRLSWFRLSYGAGQVVGLVIAAAAVTALRAGWLATAALLAVGWVLARIRLPALAPATPAAPEPPASRTSGGQRAPRHRLFVRFLCTWLLAMVGIQTFFNVVPLVMRDGFGIAPSLSSLLFLLGAGVGTVIYPLAGSLADRRGPGIVLITGLAATMIAFGAMALASGLDLPGKAVIGAVALVLAATAYSFEVVSATMMIVQISPGSQGSAMGLLNGIIAAGAVIGAIVPSFLAELWGYPVLPLVALAALLLSVLVGVPLFGRSAWRSSPPPAPQSGMAG